MKPVRVKIHYASDAPLPRTPQRPPAAAVADDRGAKRGLGRGLGDLVALIAQPIARASDAVFGTKLAGCGGCRRRRRGLNAWSRRVGERLARWWKRRRER